jgi:hypothetical protein
MSEARMRSGHNSAVTVAQRSTPEETGPLMPRGFLAEVWITYHPQLRYGNAKAQVWFVVLGL